MNSRKNLRKKLVTPSRTTGTREPLEFEAVQGNLGSDSTFSYEDVFDLATITPAVKRAGKGASTTAAAGARISKSAPAKLKGKAATPGADVVGNGQRGDERAAARPKQADENNGM